MGRPIIAGTGNAGFLGGRDSLGALVLMLLMLHLAVPRAAEARQIAVPEPLRPWKAWIEQKHPEHACPTLADGGRLCVAYASLDLDLGDRGGSFALLVTTYGRQWVEIPGDAAAWPLETRLRGGAQVPVVQRSGRPQAFLPPGEHLLEGRFAWADLPTSLAVPSRAARLGLTLRGRPVEGPEDDGNGKLLLEGKAARADSAGGSAPLSLRVYRKLVDDVPMRVETLVELAVPGGEREIVTGRLLPAGSAVLSLTSDMPARVEADGRLRAQLQPGDRSVHVTARLLAPATALGMERLDSLWPAQEIWTFEARRDIRVVELAGAPLVDPSQTGLPEDWKGLPAYRLGPGDTLRFVEKQRGDPSPQAGALNLSRQMWLDFSGKGYTQKDAVTGRLFRRTRLEMRPGAELGRAEISGRPVMITSLEGRAGVEVPAGDLNLVALSRNGRGNGFSREVTGWNQGFQSLQVGLHLPPGWRLVHADGPDGVVNSWVSDWSLWDVFLLCILTLGMLRLTGWLGALLALATFILLSQEPGLDGLLWLNLLAAVGLVRVLGVGRLHFWARRYAWASLALLAALWIPFAITHVREALYPQLDGPGGSAYGYANLNMLDLSRSGSYGSGRGMENAASLESDEMEKAAEPTREPLARSGKIQSSRGRQLKAPQDASIYSGLAEEDEGMTHAKVQTGPGEPAWGWESARLSWSGPVQEGETMRLYLMPPWLTRLARTLQALLPGVLLFLLGLSLGLNRPVTGGDGSGSAGPRLPLAIWSRIGTRLRFRGRGVAGMTLLFLTAAPSVRAQFPPDTLLRELEQRLMAPAACAPTCVALASGAVVIAGDRLRVVLVFDAVDTAVAALPQGGSGQWALESLRLDDRPAAAAARLPGGGPAVVIPPGRHRVLVEGRILGARLELAFGEGARHLTVEAPGYAVQGLKDGRAEGGTLVFLRREAPAGGGEVRRALAPDAIPPYIEVRRTLDLAQEWILETRVLRVAPASGAFSVEVPLLPFEHPLSPGMASDKGSTLVSFQEGQADAVWRSTVDRRETLAFAAGDLARFAETWRVRAASRWHLETSGPAPVQTTPDPGLAAWRPIPGDTLVLAISEPRAAGGPVKTVESASLSHSPGRREASTTLTLDYRAGQGDAARITLPSGARLDNLTVDGMSQPLTQREGALSLPLKPGLQQVVLGWKQPTGISTVLGTPRVVLGDAAANVSVSMTVPGDRWVLWVGGPAAGPALLLWGVAVVLGILGWCLGRWGGTPLGTLDWILLFLGTSTVNVYAAAPLLGLFLILRWREKEAPRLERRPHNFLQVLLAGLALLAFGILVGSVPQGLLSAPDMQITGNGSHAHELRWFADRVEGALPSGRMLSLPLWVYRLAMLAWSLWLALRLLRWLRWCWERYSAGGLWRERPAKSPRTPAPSSAP